MTYNFRSKFEQNIFSKLPDTSVYEPEQLAYNIPSSRHYYTPDIYLPDLNVFVELKGKMDLATRKKMLLVVEQHKDKRIIIVFQNPNNKLYKGSKTTYYDWAIKNGIEVWTVKELLEKANVKL